MLQVIYSGPIIRRGILLEMFDASVTPIIEQLRNLAFQNLRLAEARDLLLPRLTSGGISV